MALFLGIDLSKETFHACLLGDRPEAKKVVSKHAQEFRTANNVAEESSRCCCAHLHGSERRVLGSPGLLSRGSPIGVVATDLLGPGGLCPCSLVAAMELIG